MRKLSTTNDGDTARQAGQIVDMLVREALYHRLLGTLIEDSAKIWEALELFVEVGREFIGGADSFKKVEQRLTSRWEKHELPDDMKCSWQTIKRRCRAIEDRFGIEAIAAYHDGLGYPGLTSVGRVFWEEAASWIEQDRRQELIDFRLFPRSSVRRNVGEANGNDRVFREGNRLGRLDSANRPHEHRVS
jgi:hypothetical protein